MSDDGALIDRSARDHAMTPAQPILHEFYFHDNSGGLHECNLIECTPEQWAAMPESSDRDWCAIRPAGEGGRRILALRLPAALRRQGAAPTPGALTCAGSRLLAKH